MLKEIQRGRDGAWWAVLALTVAYALFFSAYTVQRHNAFLTTAYDLGNFDQAIWNTAHGRPLALTNIPGVSTRLAHHVEPILFLVAPLYWLWSDVRAILILQSVALGAGAIPLFWYAARQVGRAPAVGIAAIYLLFPALQGVNLFDFHAVALAPFFLLLAWNWLDERRDGPFLVASLLAAATKEEISLLVAMMGLYALVVQRRRFGWLPLVAGVGWFLVVMEVVAPAFNRSGQHEFIGFYDQWGESALEIALTLLTHPADVARWLLAPARVAYLRDLLLPTLGLSLLAPQVLLVAAPSLAVNLLSSSPFMTTLEGFHYPAAIVPFVVASGARGLRALADGVAALPTRRDAVLWGGVGAMLLATLLYHRGHGATPLAAGWQWPTVTAHHRTGAALLATVPPDVAVSAQSQINPHLSQRRTIRRFPDVGDADLIALDVTVPDLFLHPNDLRRDVEARLASGEWGVRTARDGWLLLERCTEGQPCRTTLPDSFFSYARAPDAAPQYPVDAQFGNALRLRGFDLLASPDGPQVRFYWEALRPLDEPLRPWPVFFDPSWGTVLEDTALRPLMETVWYPPTRWQPGETVRTTTLPWDFGNDWALALAVLDGWEPDSPRLPVTLRGGAVVPDGQRAGAGLLTLLHVRGGAVLPESLRRFTLPASLDPVGATLQPGDLTLAGAAFPPTARAGERLPVTLVWQAGDAPPPLDATVTLQLLGPSGLAAQSDAFPTARLDGSPLPRPTSGWAPGEVVQDFHALDLPPDLPPGEYRLVAGLYDLARDATRLTATRDGARLPDDLVPLGTVRVAP